MGRPRTTIGAVRFHFRVRNGIVYSGNWGRDSDTIGAIAGALAGAILGLDGISDDWVARVRRPSSTCLQFTVKLDIVDVAQQLVELRRKCNESAHVADLQEYGISEVSGL
jgi:broad specificity polyphosphatase/5'/3'-nucleotidase SurE